LDIILVEYIVNMCCFGLVCEHSCKLFIMPVNKTCVHLVPCLYLTAVKMCS